MSKNWYGVFGRKLWIAGVCLPMVAAAEPEVKNVPTPAKEKVPLIAKAPAKPAAEKTIPQVKTLHYEVPCLTVWTDKTHGKISYLPMTFTRTQEDKPLRIMIADDTPSGSGETIRGSVWMAAITAAMLRNDTMHGVTISMEFSGHTDGPSAGGVTCLAILSAMDGRTLPKDFAMTGTIMPDGTIGVVGGVPGKMRAAAKAGVKRILIPGFLRMETDHDGKEIDLYQLARELGVELHRVDNIAEAYAIVHHLPMVQKPYVNVRDLTTLPPEMDKVLKDSYFQMKQFLEEKLKADEMKLYEHIASRLKLAEKYFQEGRLLMAVLEMYRAKKLIFHMRNHCSF